MSLKGRPLGSMENYFPFTTLRMAARLPVAAMIGDWLSQGPSFLPGSANDSRAVKGALTGAKIGLGNVII